MHGIGYVIGPIHERGFERLLAMYLGLSFAAPEQVLDLRVKRAPFLTLAAEGTALPGIFENSVQGRSRQIQSANLGVEEIAIPNRELRHDSKRLRVAVEAISD